MKLHAATKKIYKSWRVLTTVSFLGKYHYNFFAISIRIDLVLQIRHDILILDSREFTDFTFISNLMGKSKL